MALIVIEWGNQVILTNQRAFLSKSNIESLNYQQVIRLCLLREKMFEGTRANSK